MPGHILSIIHLSLKILFKIFRHLTMKEIFEFGLSKTFGDDLKDELEFIHPNSQEILNSTKSL